MNSIRYLNPEPEEEYANPQKKPTDLEEWEAQTEKEIFEDDDFIGSMNEDDE